MNTNLFIQGNSVIHNLNFWTKFLCLLLLLPLASFIAKPNFLPILVVILLIILALSKIGLDKFWKVSKLYIISISVGVLLLSLLFTAGSLEAKLLEGLTLAVRFILLISFGMLFSNVTNPIEIPLGFLQARIPHKYGITLMVGLRMMPLLSGKVQTVVDAQKGRGADFRFSIREPGQFFVRVSSLLIPILHFTLESSVQLSDTLISRGYNPDGKISNPPLKWNLADISLLLISIFLLVTVIFN